MVKNLARIIALANQKGGVGKTTTAVNLAACLAEKGKRVLLVDSDPQGNATSGYGIDKSACKTTIYHVLIDNVPAKDAIIETQFHVDVLPANIELAGAEIELVSAISRETRLKRALTPLQDDYDYILIDCPPSLGLLTLNSLAAADSVLMPIQCEFYALEGVSQLLNTIELVRSNLNPDLAIEGVLMKMFDSRTRLSEQVVAEVRQIRRYPTKRDACRKSPLSKSGQTGISRGRILTKRNSRRSKNPLTVTAFCSRSSYGGFRRQGMNSSPGNAVCARRASRD